MLLEGLWEEVAFENGWNLDMQMRVDVFKILLKEILSILKGSTQHCLPVYQTLRVEIVGVSPAPQ